MNAYKRYLMVEVTIVADNVEEAQARYNRMESKLRSVNLGTKNGACVSDMTRVPVKILEAILKQTAHRLPESLQKWIKGKVL